MAQLALSELFDSETREEVLSTVLTIAADVGLRVTAWQPGQPIRTLLTIASQKISDATLVTKEAIKGGFLDEAEAGWLTLLARAVYRVDRKLAEFAEGDSLELTNTEATTHTLQPGELIVAHAVTGKTYRNTAVVVIPASGTVSDVAILADEAGTDSDAAPGTITELVSSLVGVTCTNVAAVLGADEETDEDLRQRCRDKLGALSPNGPKEAYAYVAKTPELAAVGVAITRVKVVANALTGLLTVYLATASGAPSAPDVAIVDAAFDKWASPWCTEAVATAASELVVPVTCQVWIQGSSLTTAQVQTEIANALARYFRDLPIGGFVIPPATGTLYLEALRQVIGSATPGILKVAITLPAADVALTVGQVAKLGTVTTTVTVVT